MTFKRTTLRYGETPEPVTPYQKAAQVWDERIGSARAQAHNWRLMALGSLGLSLILAALLLWIGRSASTIPYIVEVDPKGGARAVGPAVETYKPSDAQIAFHLARFVDHVRSLSIDPVVVRQSWLRAYDFVTDKAAVTLNEYARQRDPFARLGRESIAAAAQRQKRDAAVSGTATGSAQLSAAGAAPAPPSPPPPGGRGLREAVDAALGEATWTKLLDFAAFVGLRWQWVALGVAGYYGLRFLYDSHMIGLWRTQDHNEGRNVVAPAAQPEVAP